MLVRLLICDISSLGFGRDICYPWVFTWHSSVTALRALEQVTQVSLKSSITVVPSFDVNVTDIVIYY
jgi:hypothetical protein